MIVWFTAVLSASILREIPQAICNPAARAMTREMELAKQQITATMVSNVWHGSPKPLNLLQSPFQSYFGNMAFCPEHCCPPNRRRGGCPLSCMMRSSLFENHKQTLCFRKAVHVGRDSFTKPSSLCLWGNFIPFADGFLKGGVLGITVPPRSRRLWRWFLAASLTANVIPFGTLGLHFIHLFFRELFLVIVSS